MISSRLISLSSPSVTAAAACSGFLPVAKALGVLLGDNEYLRQGQSGPLAKDEPFHRFPDFPAG